MDLQGQDQRVGAGAVRPGGMRGDKLRGVPGKGREGGGSMRGAAASCSLLVGLFLDVRNLQPFQWQSQ